MMRSALYLLMCCALLTSMHLNAQTFTIAEPAISTCTGVVYDSGGAGGAGYGNNEAFTSTICPASVGASVALNFVLFDLSTAAAPDDQLAIYDGASTSAPLLGVYTDQLLQGLVVTASSFNVSGCLTLVFTSNSTGVGNFAASVSCAMPCAAPLALWAAAMPDTVRLCPGGELSVDGSASLPAPDRTITSYIWNAGSAGLDTTATPAHVLPFATGGAYRVYLQVVDDLGCPSAATDPVLVLVAETPSFAGTLAPEVVCIPATIDLFGHATIVPLIEMSEPCLDIGPGLFLPDDIGLPFETVIPIGSGFPGEQVNGAEDLGDICLNIEHSYMGDLVIELECPNGQSVMLHQQGGGNTFLGDANDQDWNGAPEPGICWNYCFNANPENGTWAESSNAGTTPNVLPTSQGTALAPGSYTSVQPLSNLIGCPVNGDWTLRIIDLWGADNGFLCSWCSGFGVDVDSSTVVLSPTLSLADPDSAYWSGTEVSNDPFGTGATATAASGGELPFTFTVVDSYGCQHDTTVFVGAMEPPVVDAGEDLILCADSAQVAVTWQSGAALSCTYSLVLTDAANDGWNGGANLQVIQAGDTAVYTLPSGGVDTVFLDVTDGMVIELLYTAGVIFNSENNFTLFDADGTSVYVSPDGPQTGVAYIGIAECAGSGWSNALVQWTPSTGLSDPTGTNPWLFTTTSGWYTVSIAPGALPGCAGTDSLWVEANAQPMGIVWTEANGTLCASIDTLITYEWWLNGTLETTTTTPCITDPADGEWAVVGNGLAECPYTSGTLLLCPIVTVTYNTGLLIAQGAVGAWSWTLDGAPIPDVIGPILTPQSGGLYVATVSTASGCVVSASITVTGFSGMDDASNDPRTTVYPVPTDGSFTVVADGLTGPTVTLRLTDMSGRVVHERIRSAGDGTLNTTLSLGLNAGSYLLTIADLDGVRVLRVMVR